VTAWAPSWLASQRITLLERKNQVHAAPGPVKLERSEACSCNGYLAKHQLNQLPGLPDPFQLALRVRTSLLEPAQLVGWTAALPAGAWRVWTRQAARTLVAKA